MSMGAHLHGTIWMILLLMASGLLASRLGWNIWLVFALAFLPAFVVGHVIGEHTFGIQRWLDDRRSASTRGRRHKTEE